MGWIGVFLLCAAALSDRCFKVIVTAAVIKYLVS